jgi:hypothetical protein
MPPQSRNSAPPRARATSSGRNSAPSDSSTPWEGRSGARPSPPRKRAGRNSARPAQDVLPISVDIERAASIALAAASHLTPVGPQFKALPDFDHRTPTRLRNYALAALYAHVVANEASRDDERFTPVLEEATKLRELLLGAAEVLALFALVPADPVAEIRTGSGRLDAASDLIALNALFKAQWKRVEGKTPVTRPQVERTGVLGTELDELVASRKFVGPGDPASDDPQRTRARAFTLLVRKYDECRRGVAYLRWKFGDATRSRRPCTSAVAGGRASRATTNRRPRRTLRSRRPPTSRPRRSVTSRSIDPLGRVHGHRPGSRGSDTRSPFRGVRAGGSIEVRALSVPHAATAEPASTDAELATPRPRASRGQGHANPRRYSSASPSRALHHVWLSAVPRRRLRQPGGRCVHEHEQTGRR